MSEQLKPCPLNDELFSECFERWCPTQAEIAREPLDWDDVYAICKNVISMYLVNTRTDGWVSVDDRLPKEDDIVLICEAENEIRTAQYHDGEWWDNGCVFVFVTHWMPLPTPPKGA